MKTLQLAATEEVAMASDFWVATCTAVAHNWDSPPSILTEP